MDIFWEELTYGLPDTRQFIHVLIRLIASAFLGAVIGLQRERVGKPAGIKTHILATLGTTVFVLACAGYGMSSDGLSRVIQGIVTGIGFLGAGAILKLDEKRDIKGLTTAASIWISAAIGVAVGLGGLGLALLATILTLIVLAVLGKLELRVFKKGDSESEGSD
ncbi:MAG TPA: MgtC/SapB family protein [Pyrinomonadaceae bacterium]|jgi:putative Mg2+ transporter-C (MgtC) family protein|nr:MgtC/SapB family protein [Pyrinomonadaceae bacterium]